MSTSEFQKKLNKSINLLWISLSMLVLILLFLLATGVSLRAQTLARYSSPDLSSALSVDPGTVSPLYRQVYGAPMHVKFSIPGEKKKKVGRTMTILGGALIVGGIAVCASADPYYEETTYNQTTGQYETQTIDPKYLLGGFMIALGVGASVPGVIIWRKGIREYDKYMIEQGDTGALRLGVGHGGAVLSYRF